jgi:hypothetical protein
MLAQRNAIEISVKNPTFVAGPGGTVKLFSQWNDRNFISAIVEGQSLLLEFMT